MRDPAARRSDICAPMRGGGGTRMACDAAERSDVPRVLTAMTIDKDRVEGSATNLGGKAKEGLGKSTGDSKTEAEGNAAALVEAAFRIRREK
jgi:hypothetical protein